MSDQTFQPVTQKWSYYQSSGDGERSTAVIIIMEKISSVLRIVGTAASFHCKDCMLLYWAAGVETSFSMDCACLIRLSLSPIFTYIIHTDLSQCPH